MSEEVKQFIKNEEDEETKIVGTILMLQYNKSIHAMSIIYPIKDLSNKTNKIYEHVLSKMK